MLISPIVVFGTHHLSLALHTLSKLASCAPLCTVWLLRQTLNCVAMVPGKIEVRLPGQLVFRNTLLCELMVHLL